MTTLLRCRFCEGRVPAADVVYFGDRPAHPGCADIWYDRLAEVTP